MRALLAGRSRAATLLSMRSSGLMVVTVLSLGAAIGLGAWAISAQNDADEAEAALAAQGAAAEASAAPTPTPTPIPAATTEEDVAQLQAELEGAAGQLAGVAGTCRSAAQ